MNRNLTKLGVIGLVAASLVLTGCSGSSDEAAEATSAEVGTATPESATPEDEADLANESVVDQPQQPALILVTVPQIVGMFNKDAERAMNSVGLQAMIMPQTGDPSIAAQTTNGCVVISQSPSAGAQVERGSRISANMECPNTGYQAPALPQPYYG